MPLVVRDKGHPMPAALIKEFGLYPAGCTVRLAGGEPGVVARRGDNANAPVVPTATLKVNMASDKIVSFAA